MMSNYLILLIGCGLVTWIPRILPFVFAKKLVFPEKVKLFLDYLPLCILAALFFQSLLISDDHLLPQLKLEEVIACIPTLLVGIRTKDLMKIVITGVVTMALIRLIAG